MPELPEVEALAGFLRERAAGRFVRGVEVGSVQALKTVDPSPGALAGLQVEDVTRRGKHLDLRVGGLHLVVHLARAGWVRWSDRLPAAAVRPGRGPVALRVRLAGGADAADDGTAGFDVTEAGTRKSVAVHVVRDPAEVPGVARLGPEPLADDFTRDRFAALLAGHGGARVKGVLRDQSVIAGIGNAYSDEILHAARLSPFRPADRLDDDEVDRLHDAVRTVLLDAVERSRGLPAGELKDDKRAAMRVHGRTGLPCPVCGDVVREVSFADRSLQYCPTCQTGGTPLADRRMSRLLK